MPPLHLSQAELAAYWRISPRTLERWRCTGNGPRFLKLGSRVVYRIADVEAFEATRLHRHTVLRANRKVEKPAELPGNSKARPYAHLRSAAQKLYSLRNSTQQIDILLSTLFNALFDLRRALLELTSQLLLHWRHHESNPLPSS